MLIKRSFAIIISLFLVFSVVTGCSNSAASSDTSSESGNDGKDGNDGKNGGNGNNGNNGSDFVDNLKPAIGKIYYSDGTASYSYFADKKPVGFVASINADGSVDTIIALEQSPNKISFGYDGTSEVTTTENDGEANCAEIIEKKANGPAVGYCRQYDAGIKGFEAGKWYLPARKELLTIADNEDLFTESQLALIKNGYRFDRFSKTNYWTSTLFVTTYTDRKNRMFWVVNLTTGEDFYSTKSNEYNVRPMYKFHYNN